jgi:uncharacterized protein (TIGR00369 family)
VDRAPPEGFVPHTRKSPLTDPWEPIYARETAQALILGVYLRPEHCNGRGMAHGGLIAALSDNAMGLSCSVAAKAAGRTLTGLVTASLSLDYMGRADVGQWLAFETTFVKLGKTLSFTNLMVTADGKPVAKAGATFAVAS